MDSLKSRIFSVETKRLTAGAGVDASLPALTLRLRETCLSVKRIAATLLDDFYPVTQEMKDAANGIRIDCSDQVPQKEFNQSTAALMAYLELLKRKISNDFSFINDMFLGLLGQVKPLEKALKTDLDDDNRIQEIEQFEQNIHREMGSIMDSFSIQQTVAQIKEAVFNRLSNIKHLVSVRKNEETKNIQNLKTLQRNWRFSGSKNFRKISDKNGFPLIREVTLKSVFQQDSPWLRPATHPMISSTRPTHPCTQ